MDDTAPARIDVVEEYEQLAADAALLTDDQAAALAAEWRRKPSRKYRRAVEAAETLAYEHGRVVEQGDMHMVAGAAPAYADLAGLLVADPDGGPPVGALVDLAYAALTVDMLDPQHTAAITGRWVDILDPEPDTAPEPEPELVRVPAPRGPVDATVDVPLGPPAQTAPAATRPARPARPRRDPGDDAIRQARRADPARRRRRLRVRSAGALLGAAAAFLGTPFLLGLATQGKAPAWTAGGCAVALVLLLAYGTITARAAGRIR
ncbi:hypothetical protein AB0B88_16055 [Micromonospora haikouensis]|uniref:hypothetical protein n=1 Tax=Micromonospora haikouensis TaxID=686309 RepID=UPI0033CF9F7D